MKFLSMLGANPGDWVSSWSDFLDVNNVGAEFTTWLKPFLNVLTIVLWVVLALVGAAGGIYAVYVGIKMARADSAEAREENKKRLINLIITIVTVIVLIIFFNAILPGLVSVLGHYKLKDENGKEPGSTGGAVQAAVTAAKVFLRLPL